MTSNETPQKEVTIVLGTLKDIAEAVVHAAEAGTLRQVFQQIAYEAVSNIIRHAKATKATIEATEDTAWFRMVIRDNGSGFSTESSSEHEGLGLHNMMQRARIYGGTINIESVPGSGTRLALKLPI